MAAGKWGMSALLPSVLPVTTTDCCEKCAEAQRTAERMVAARQGAAKCLGSRAEGAGRVMGRGAELILYASKSRKQSFQLTLHRVFVFPFFLSFLLLQAFSPPIK